MRATVTLLMASVALIAMADHSIAQKPNLSTCSGNRAYCIAGVTRRNESTVLCEQAYQFCMQTGVWDTTRVGQVRFGTTVPHSRVKSGVAKQ